MIGARCGAERVCIIAGMHIKHTLERQAYEWASFGVSHGICREPCPVLANLCALCVFPGVTWSNIKDTFTHCVQHTQ